MAWLLPKFVSEGTGHRMATVFEADEASDAVAVMMDPRPIVPTPVVQALFAPQR